MKNIKVKNTDELRTAMDAGYTRDEIEIVAQDTAPAIAAARQEGAAEGRATGLDEGQKLGATNERTRLAALAEVVEEGFEAEHKLAIEAGHTPQEFAYAQTKAKKDRGITVGAIKKDSKGAQHAAAGDADASEGKGNWKKIEAKHGAKAQA